LFAEPIAATVTFAGGLDADVYSPASDTATCRAAIVWVHGGGFTSGTRAGPAERAWGSALARRGYTVVSIDYRLGDGEQFGVDIAEEGERAAIVADAIADARTAVAWLRESAASLGIDPQRIAIGGTSAGAMTALGTALTATDDSERVCTVVSVAGAIRGDWVAGTAPPALFVHGEADELVPFESASDAQAAIAATGAATQLVPVDGSGHEITGVPPDEVVLAVVEWLLVHAATGCG
jgi:acetyl esterase/lipase